MENYKQFMRIILLACFVSFLGLQNSLAAGLQLPTNQSARKLRILSIDGGGVRGVIPARILQAIEEQTGQPIAELFDLVIGNSTGGLVALALVTPNEQGGIKYKASDLVAFYKHQTPKIFQRSVLRNLRTGWGLWGPKYNRQGLDHALQSILGDVQLSQTLKPAVVLSYSLDKGLPHLWTTQQALTNTHKDYYLRDVAGATSAAPTYFSPKVIHTKEGHILHEADGGLWTNNPELTAIIAISRMNKNPKHNSFNQTITQDDVVLVSIGTGTMKLQGKLYAKQAAKLKHAGVVGWLLKAQPNLIEMMMGADSDWSASTISALYPHSYRIQVPIAKELSSMDASNNVPKLQQAAEQYMQDNALFKDLCDKLLQLSAQQE